MEIFTFGLAEGVGIALLAAAFQLVYLPTRVFYIGMAAIYGTVPYVVLLMDRIFPFHLLSVFAAVIAGGLFSLAVYRLNHLPLIRREASEGLHLISSLGIYLVVVQVIIMIWGSGPYPLELNAFANARVGQIALEGRQITLLVFGSALLAAIIAGLWRSGLGLKMRALASDARLFASQGYNVEIYRSVAFFAGGVVCAAAALLRANGGAFDPNLGMTAMLYALSAAFIGGRNSFIGPVVAGLFIGVIQAMVGWNFDAKWQQPFTFAVLVLVLLVCPDGIFAVRRRVEEVAR